MFKRLDTFFCSSRVLSILIIVFMCVSCGYHYIDYQFQFEKSKSDLQAIHAEYKEIKWETIQSIIGVLNREGKLHAKLVAHIMRKDIEQAYPDLSVLQQKFDRNVYSDEHFNSIIINTVSSNSFLGNVSSRNGVLVSCDDKVLYNLIISSDRFDTDIEEFIRKNYNVQLAESTFESLRHNSDTLKLLEPYGPTSVISKGHRMINTSSLEELKRVYMTEGLEGLSGYILINPFYIVNTGDIFNVPDFDVNGMRTKNHKLIVMSYISIYDIIRTYHNERIINLNKLEQEAVSKNQVALVQLYYSSIKSMILHFFFIIATLLVTRNIKKEH